MDTFIEGLLGFILGAVALLAGAWWVMIALGAAHSHYGGIPPVSYITTLWLVSAATATYQAASFSAKDL